MFKEIIDERLKELIPSPKTSLYESTRYALLSPGKRFRPSLVMAVAASLGADPKIALDPACAIEMVHTYSLIHDDLPCMDNDDLRRGRPTLHKAFDEGLALLTGDYLLTYSFEILSNTAVLSTSQKLQMVQILSHAAGSHGMIGGQAIDLDMTGKSIDEATLYEMHHGKTSDDSNSFSCCWLSWDDWRTSD
ncbi:MAG: polyprenyl synthetase family protein [Chlamydiae bacterium]|nr:polyprenyl synthetase family protein [Chlamydiota bacterium]